MQQHGVRSCNQCSAIGYCHGATHVEASLGRDTAENCSLPWKGRATETVPIEGYRRGLSRKRAVEAVLQKKASWTIQGALQLADGFVLHVQARRRRAGIVRTPLGNSFGQQESG